MTALAASAASCRFDAVVVGAGSAGSAAALSLAQRGLAVALVEKRARERAGARWINGVPGRLFDAAGVARPSGGELLDRGVPVTVITLGGARPVSLEASPLYNVDMRHLVARLQRGALQSQVEIVDRARVANVELAGERPRAVAIERRDDRGRWRPAGVLEARLFVDASGLTGVLRRAVPTLAADCRDPDEAHICSAAQQLCEVADRDAALAFHRQLGVTPGCTINRFGVEGGWSTELLGADRELRHAHMVTGAIAGGGRRSGTAILNDLKRREPWLGEKIVGGAGLIPLRRPYDRLAAPGVALVGDAACMVFSLHGSGVGMGVAAGAVLADAVAAFDDPGSREATWTYQRAFQRRFGATLGAIDLLRRFFQTLSEHEADRLTTLGFLSSRSMTQALEQRVPVPSPLDVVRVLRGLARAPHLAVRALPLLAQIPAVSALYKRYPARPNERALRRWSRAVARLFGERPDVR